MKTAYEVRVAAVERAINEADPIGLLDICAPSDEYAPEIGTIIPRLVNAQGVDEVTAVRHAEFLPWTCDCVVPPPPSVHRTMQPAVLIAAGIAGDLGVRAPLLSAAIQASTDAVQGRRVLLIDDLWETGSTRRRVAEVPGQMGATEVRALGMARTK